MIKNIIGHTKTVAKHKWIVFKLACRAGIPWRGFVHDLSKFRPSEFRLGQFYAGNQSPINIEKQKYGYSISWIEHTNRNKHHWEYWVDRTNGKIAPIPEKYVKEMVCDTIAASRAYTGKDWKPEILLEYMQTKCTWPDEIKDLTMPLIIAKIQKYKTK